MITNANSILFRSSSLGLIMTESKTKSEPLGATCISQLLKVYAWEKYHRREEISSKFLQKGNIREEDSLTLLSVLHNKLYKKNEANLKNEFITGTPDTYLGDAIENASEILDTKTSWSVNTFLAASFDKLDKIYEWQGHAYMSLTGAKHHTVAYCLVNGTKKAIRNERKKVMYDLELSETNCDANEEYRHRCAQIEINHIVDSIEFKKENEFFEYYNDEVPLGIYDIPMSERLHTFTFERDEEKIEKMYEKIKLCRLWMNNNLFIKD